MIKLNRLTDYAVMILAQMGKEPGTITKSASLAAETGLPQPTISKILKILTKKSGRILQGRERGILRGPFAG